MEWRGEGAREVSALTGPETSTVPEGIPGRLLLLGVVGSQAYGLGTAASDVDLLGVRAASMDEVLGLGGAKAVEGSWVSHDPDCTVHELGKFVRLCLDANPTVMEALWLPHYRVLTPAGEALVQSRGAFLSAPRVRAAYAGYVRSQAHRLETRSRAGVSGFAAGGASRTAKHGRHCARLLVQGEILLRSGRLLVDVSEFRDRLVSAGEMAVAAPESFASWARQEADRLLSVPSQLPEKPDTALVQSLLVRTRRELDT